MHTPRRLGNGLLKLLAGIALGGAPLAAWQFDTQYPLRAGAVLGQSGSTDTAYGFEADKSGSPKAYARGNRALREGGFGSLLRDPQDASGSTFWALNDRGLAIGYQTTSLEAKVFSFPGYHQKLVKFRVGADSLEWLEVDSIASWESPTIFTVGLPTSKRATGEIALQGSLKSPVVDEAAVLAAQPNGYDFEALRWLPSGNFIASDELGPFLVEIDRTSKRILREWYPGHGLPKVFANRRDNHGFEAMAVTPNGAVVAALQSPACNPKCAAKSSRAIRVLWFDPTTSKSREYIYLSDLKGTSHRDGAEVKLGDMVALSETRFLVVEHGDDGLGKDWIDLVEFDLAAATDVHASNDNSTGILRGGLTLEQLGLDTSEAVWKTAGIAPVSKQVRLGDLLGRGIWTSSKPEGLELLGDSAVVLLHDNDYGVSDKNSDGIAHLRTPYLQAQSLVYLRLPPSVAVAARPGAARLTTRQSATTLWVAAPFLATGNLQLRDALGRTLARGQVRDGKGTLELGAVPAGPQLLEVWGPQGHQSQWVMIR